MNKIIEVRKKKGLTQQQLADLCGMKRPRISVLENEKSSPTAKTLERLATALDCEPRDLM